MSRLLTRDVFDQNISKTRKAKARRINGPLLIAVIPPALYLFVLYILPSLIMFSYSFWKLDENYRLFPAWNLSQYQYFFTRPTYQVVLLTSFQIAFLNTLLNLLVAYPLAYFLARFVQGRMKNLFLVMLLIPAWTSFLIRVYAWMLLLGDNGLVNYALQYLYITKESLSLLFNRNSLLLVLMNVYLPYMLLPIYASLEKISPALLEAGRALGASPWRTFLRVTLPMSLPGVIAGCMITFIPTLGEYVAPALVGGRQGFMYGNLVQQQFAVFDWPLGSAMAAILLFAVLVLMFGFSRLVKLEDVWTM